MKTTIEFSEKAANALERLAQELDTTKADVIRSALALYGFLVRELRDPKGRRQLGIIEDESRIKKIVFVPGMEGSEEEIAAG